MASKVRYLTISRIAIELVCSLPEKENAQFLKIMFSCFQQLENGDIPSLQETENPVLNIALREAIDELVTGYKNYLQKKNARKNSGEKRRSISDQSANNRRLIVDEEEIDKDIDKDETDYVSPHPGGMQEYQKKDIEASMQVLGLVPDEGFWNTCNYYGYEKASECFAYAQSIDKKWTLKGITKLIANGFENE